MIHDEGQTLEDIYNERAPLYEKYADLTVWQDDAQIRFEEVIEAIRAALGKPENQ